MDKGTHDPTDRMGKMPRSIPDPGESSSNSEVKHICQLKTFSIKDGRSPKLPEPFPHPPGNPLLLLTGP